MMKRTPETPKELSVRIHYDWWNKCRTCEFWTGDRDSMEDGKYTKQNSEIYIMDSTDGSNLTRLTNNDGYDSRPAWSPVIQGMDVPKMGSEAPF